MKKIFLMLKEKLYLDKPIVVFSLITFLLLIVCLAGNNFQIPDIYINRDLAQSAAILDDATEANILIQSYKNPLYKFYKPFFHLVCLFSALLLFCIIFKRKTFKDFFYVDIFRNKYFVYFWINISYILFAIFRINFYMTDIELKIYHKFSDSRGIPYIDAILEMWFDALKYYPATNVLFFITYNTKISSRFYSLIYVLAIIFYFKLLFETMEYHFSVWTFLIYLYYIICIGVILSAIKELKEKRAVILY